MQGNAECRHVASGARNVMTADNGLACPHWARGTGVIFARTRPRICNNSADLATRTQESSGQDLSFLLQFTFVILRSEGKGEYSIPHDITDWIRWKSFTFQRKIWNVNSPDSISIYLEEAPPRRSENYIVDFFSWTLTIHNMYIPIRTNAITTPIRKLWLWINWKPKKYH